MKEQVKIFFTALMFYTRIPCPKTIDHSEEYINKATRYFPMVGYIVALIQTIVFVSSLWLFGKVEISIVLMMVAQILTTGAFHEDGFADVCDGFGGGWTKEKILDIMKDSRVGAYGVIGTILLLLLKFFCFVILFNIIGSVFPNCFYNEFRKVHLLKLNHSLNFSLAIFVVLSALNGISRLVAASFIFTHNYVSIDDTSKAKPVANNVNFNNFWIALIITLIPLPSLFYYHWAFALVFIPILMIRYLLGNYFNKWIGGYTGDCLGATQQIMEVIFSLGLIAVWRFI